MVSRSADGLGPFSLSCLLVACTGAAQRPFVALKGDCAWVRSGSECLIENLRLVHTQVNLARRCLGQNATTA